MNELGHVGSKSYQRRWEECYPEKVIVVEMKLFDIFDPFEAIDIFQSVILEINYADIF